MSLTLFGVLKSRASRNAWLLEELSQPYDVVAVVQAYRLADPSADDAPLNTASPAFRQINPNGLIPTLKDGDLVLHESLAINLYLARKFGGPLAGQTPQEDGLITMWTMWAATTCEPHSIQIIFHRKDLPEEARDHDLANAAVEGLRAPFDVLEAALAPTGWLVGGRFTLADLNLAEVLRYAQPAEELFADYTAISAWIAACQSRPAFRKMWAARAAEV